MVRKIKKRTQNPKPTEQTQSSASNTTNASNTNQPSTDTSQSTSNANADASGGNNATTLVTGAQLDETIANLMGIGFEREQVVLALRAAYIIPIFRFNIYSMAYRKAMVHNPLQHKVN
eukprot:277009_1